jgi:hypothetical protein
MKKGYSKSIDYLLLVMGGAILLYEQGKESEQNVYILIVSFAVFMYALYKVTSIWTSDNPKPPKKDEYVSLLDEEFVDDELDDEAENVKNNGSQQDQ